MAMITVNPADTVHAVTKSICRKLLDRADDLMMLPSTRRDLAAVVAGTTPRYFNYMTFGETSDRGYENTKITLRLDFDRVRSEDGHRTVDNHDGARYMIQSLRLHIETSQQVHSVATMRLYVEHLQKIIAVAAEIEAEYAGCDLYLLLATAEEVVEQNVQRLLFMLSEFIKDHVAGLRCGQSKLVMTATAERFPGIIWPSQYLGVSVGKGAKCRTYDVSVGNVALMVTRTS